MQSLALAVGGSLSHPVQGPGSVDPVAGLKSVAAKMASHAEPQSDRARRRSANRTAPSLRTRLCQCQRDTPGVGADCPSRHCCSRWAAANIGHKGDVGCGCVWCQDRGEIDNSCQCEGCLAPINPQPCAECGCEDFCGMAVCRSQRE